MSNIYSVSLDGNDAFSAIDHADFKPTGAFTVGAWVKTSSASAAQTIFSSGNISTLSGFDIRVQSGKGYIFSGKNTGSTQGTDWQELFGATTINNGAWHWLVATSDGSNLKIYIDGNTTPDGSIAWANNPAYNVTNYVRVGCMYTAGGDANFFTGNLEEVFLINGTAWSAATVASYYKKSIAYATNLKAYYQFENNGNDSSGNDHTLTDIGDPAYQTDVPFVRTSGFFAIL